MHSAIPDRYQPDLDLIAAIALKMDAPVLIAEAPDGARLALCVHGEVTGPRLQGRIVRSSASLLVGPDGVGVLRLQMPVLASHKPIGELEATLRVDFGADGHKQACSLDLQDAALGGCPRFLTGDARHLWLNRTVCLGVGKLRTRSLRLDFDLFAIGHHHASRAVR